MNNWGDKLFLSWLTASLVCMRNLFIFLCMSFKIWINNTIVVSAHAECREVARFCLHCINLNIQKYSYSMMLGPKYHLIFKARRRNVCNSFWPLFFWSKNVQYISSPVWTLVLCGGWNNWCGEKELDQNPLIIGLWSFYLPGLFEL